MANRVCFYFQVHQPYRLKDIRYADVGGDSTYFDDEKNRAIFRKVSEKCYLPANATILRMLKADPGFRVSYSLSGVFLDQCKEYGPDVLRSFQELAETGQVEFLAETYHHSLSSIASLREFCEQVTKHSRAIRDLFGQTPTVFRNTELIFNNEIAQVVRLMGFEGIVTEGTDRHLNGRTPNVPHRTPSFRLPRAAEATIAKYRPRAKASRTIDVLLKNYKLSDDVAFRFSDKNWSCHPLHSDTYADWIAQVQGHSVNLFMDYETFGEHQWADTGIFQFLESLPAQFAARGIRACTPSQVVEEWDAEHPTYDVHTTISWADTERDLSAWRGNAIQNASLDAIYKLEAAVKKTKDADLLETWRKLQTSDHVYYMCTKYWADGDVHKYFSPYDSPYEAYRRYSHALADLRVRLAAYKTGAKTRSMNARTRPSPAA
jgi:alpha-amylase